jgi:glucan phosphoethanolaminetransferase (alkaline phosphatase superfamily)
MTKTLRKLWARFAPVKGFVYILTAHLLFSLLYIVLFIWQFRSRILIAPLHLLLVLEIMLATILLMGLPLLSKRFRSLKAAKFLIVPIPACGSFALIFLYMCDYVSNRFWGGNVNYSLMWDYLFRFNSLVKQLPVNVLWVYVPLTLLILCIFATYLLMARALFQNLEELLLPGRVCSLFHNRARAIKSAVVIALLLLSFPAFSYLAANRQRLSVDVSREPILGFFITTPTFLIDNHKRLLIKLADRNVREQYPRQQNFDRKNVILIIADSLRADHMQLYGYDRPTTPFLSKLAKTGSLRKVEMGFSMCAETVCGVMSTLSSKNLRHICSQNFTIYDLLHDQGYESYFILSGSHDWYGMREYYGKEMKLYFDGTDSRRYSLNDDHVLFEGLERVPDFAGTPAFFYFHLMSPHYAGEKFDEYCNYLPKDQKLDVTSFLAGNYNTTLMRNNYDDKVVQTDAIIQQLFGELQNKGYLQNSLVVILGDHGDGLGEHGCFGHVYDLYQPQMRIPILFYDEAKVRYANLKLATQIDIMPTVVDRLGLPIPACWEGLSLLKNELRDYSYHYASPRLERYAVMYKTEKALYKYIRLNDDEEEKLYDLVSDPDEKKNLLPTADATLIETLRGRYRENFEEKQN